MSTPAGYPLSNQQTSLVATGATSRTVSLHVSLPGVAPESVPARLDTAVARHEVLRSTLQQEAQLRTGLQLVHEDGTGDWTVLGAGDDVSAAVGGLAGRLDPAAGPVVAGIVAPEGDGAAVWLCACALFSDLGTLTALAGEAAGGDAVEDPIQYTEYGAWQAEIVAEADSEDARSAAVAWGRLADEEVQTALPRIEDADSPTEVLAATPSGDPVASWLAAWVVTIARLTGEPSVTLGVEVDPRDNPELEGAAGPYSRVVPLTFEVPSAGSFASLVGSVADALAQAAKWFEWSPAAASPEVLFSAGPIDSRVDRAAFQVELRVAGDGSRGTVLAGSDDTAGIAARASAGLTQVLSQLSADAVEALDVLDGGIVEALLGPAAAPVAVEPVIARVLAHAAATPDRVALTDGRSSVTYAQLRERVDGLAGAILAAGGAGPVAVHLPRSVDAVVAMLAAQRTGRGYVPLDVDGPPERAVLQAGLAGADVLVGAAPEGWSGPVVAVDAVAEAGLPDPAAADLAYVLFTSGSTGVPKGVLVGQDALAGYAAAVLQVVEAAAGRPGAELSWGQVTGLTTDLGNTSIYGALASGGTLHLVPSELLQDPAALAAHLADAPVDVLKITPTHLRALLADPDADVLPSRVLVLGGEALGWDLVRSVSERGGCTVVNHYGPTETTVGALTYTVGDIADSGAVPIGRPLAGYEALVVDGRSRLVPPGAVGELLVAGVGVARGYVGDEAATAAAFVEHPYRPGARAYRTGDLVRRDSAGDVTFVGRRDGQVKVRGYRVEPQEIEVALTKHPDVRRAAVVLRHDLAAEPTLVGYVVTQVNPSPTEASLREHLAALLPEHMVPSRLVDLDTLPLRANGKLDVQALPVPPRQVAGAFEPPVGETEQELAAIFSQSLGVERVGANDDFFALGGHSLLATRVVVEIRGRLGVQLPVYTLFDAPSVRLLAAEVEAVRGGPSAEELSALIAEIASMSDEEAAQVLADEARPAEESHEGGP